MIRVMTQQTDSQPEVHKPEVLLPRDAGSTRTPGVVLLVLGLFAQWAFYYFPTQRAQNFPGLEHPDFFVLLQINLAVVFFVGWFAWLCLGKPERKLDRFGLIGLGLYGGAILGYITTYGLLNLAKHLGHFNWPVVLFSMRCAPFVGALIALPAIYLLRHKSIWLLAVISITLAGLILTSYGHLLGISCYNVEHLIPYIKGQANDLQSPSVAILAICAVVLWHRRPGNDPIHQFHHKQPIQASAENGDHFIWTMIVVGTIGLVVGTIGLSFFRLPRPGIGSLLTCSVFMLYPITSGLLVHWHLKNRLNQLSAFKRIIQLIRSTWAVVFLGIFTGAITFALILWFMELLTRMISIAPTWQYQYQDLTGGIAGICALAAGLLVVVKTLKMWGATLSGPAFDQLWIIGLSELPLGLLITINAVDWFHVYQYNGHPLLAILSWQTPYFILGLTIAAVGGWALSTRLKLDKDVHISLQNQASFCQSCGYNLTGTLAAGRDSCPECGEKIEHENPSNATVQFSL